MFDIGSYELLIIAIVMLLVVGPKDLPVFLRTIAKYVGAVKRQANEFRAQFDEALRDSELDQLRKDVNDMKSDIEADVRAAASELDGLDRATGAASASSDQDRTTRTSADDPSSLSPDPLAETAASDQADALDKQAGPDKPADLDQPAGSLHESGKEQPEPERDERLKLQA